MVPNLSRKFFGIFALTAMTVWSFMTFNVNLGLDLQGGARMVYRLNFDKAQEEGQISPLEDRQLVLQDTIQIFLKRLDGSGMKEVPIYPQGEESIVIELPGHDAEAIESVKRTIVNQGSLQFRIVADSTDDLAIPGEIEKLREWQATNPDQPVRAFNRIPEGEGGPRSGVLWVALGESAAAEGGLDAAPGLGAALLRNEDQIRGTEPGTSSSWGFTGAGLDYVGPGMDDKGFPSVTFEFQEHRKAAFADFTEDFRDRRMAIVLNNEIHSAPNIMGRLPGGGIITGGMNGFSSEEMRELITVLRTGSLKIQPELESSSFVGGSLGADSVRIGLQSAMAGGIMVLLFMLLYYRVNGMIACLALLFNGFILFGALSFTQATLTLPGLAGLVLTIGMAVDANILIFERVREERKRGREVPQAYKNGYERAFTTIVDANLTTLITSLILFKVGTGPVRGFAATLSLGVVTSMFSTLVFSKVLMHGLVFAKKKPLKEVKMTRALAGNAHFSFIGKRKGAAILSTILLLSGLFMFSRSSGDMMGIDFTGGSVARVQLNAPTKIGDIRDKLGMAYSVTKFDSGDSQLGPEESDAFLVKMKATDIQANQGDTGQTYIEQDLRERLDGQLRAEDPFPEINTIGKRVSGEIQDKAIQAIFLSLIAIVIYMNFRFKEYRFGLAAVTALFHDVLFTLGALAVFHHFGLVQVEINLEIIAAFLTIIGYSLNDTIVVFDRIRENIPRQKGKSFKDIIDMSINQSLSRTILTSVTTFFVVAVLFFANRPQHTVLEGFSFAMLIGVVVGTYSSMFIASPMLVFLDRWARHKMIKTEKAK
ncbi:MAG: protein translocase subunit SecD [Planctomycetota bacterium]|jgi:protein-export membrane protein SecD/preprotein translocase SecF subunit|nr:protein translocase subunit SecD [Planctomycetota bacterium]MDP6941485.1 protein translocase subunit SecD [Planctomycetota bacterium]